MIKLIGLDFDGVIIRGSNEGYFDCYHQSIASVGVTLEPKIERQRIIDGWGSGYVEQIELLLKEHPELVDQAAKTWDACVKDPAFKKGLRVVDGVAETIAQLSKIADVVIISGSERQEIQKFLDENGIKGVKKIYSSYDVESNQRKPHPYMLELAMSEFGAQSSETIFVGDMENDVEMAVAAHVIPIVALTGFLDEPEARKIGVEHIIPSLSELKKLIEKI